MKLLIADDDRTIHISFTKFFTENGFEVLHAYDGEEALRIAEEQLPELILLDLTMPKLDGRTVCQRLKDNETTKEIKIIILTAKENQLDVTLGYELGADDYVTKPCSTFYLDRAIKNLFNKPS